MSSKRVAIVLVLDDAKRVLVVTSTKYPGLSLPGGKLEGGESYFDAAARELHEETGLLVDMLDLEHVDFGFGILEPDMRIGILRARRVRGVARQVEARTGVLWVPFTQLVETPPFGAFYAKHFPEGVEAYAPTTFA